MNPLSAQDQALIAAARATIGRRYAPDRHLVGAALRTRSGLVFTGVHIETTVGRIAVCAEAIALGRAATGAGDTAIDTIVAVYQTGPPRAGETAPIVSPCGMCREMIADYAPNAFVIVPGPDGRGALRSIADLLPEKFTRSVS